MRCNKLSINHTISKLYKLINFDGEVIENVEIPTTLVECGFLSNPEEEAQLQNEEYQDRLAWGIYNGIIDYFYE